MFEFPTIEKEKIEIGSEQVERLEQAKLAIDDKINLLLTKGGLKPASEITLQIKTVHDKNITEHMSEREIEESLSLIKELGLPYYAMKREVIEESYETSDEPALNKYYQRERMNVLVGRSSEDLEFLKHALESKSEEVRGNAFGFPSTSIEAFMGKREALDRQSLPQEIKHSDGILFSSPTLSKDHWREEIKQGQRYGEFIKKISPKLYKEMQSKALETID